MKLETIHIMVEGEGESMLLLHGWGVDHTMMKPLFDYYKSRYKVCLLDLPGFGKSVPLPYSYSIYDYVVTIKNLIQLYHLENPIVIAHSFGCRIAFHYAALFPVRYIIATGAAGIRKRRGLNYYFKVYTYKILKKFSISNNMGSEDYKRANPILRETLVKIVNDDCRNDIKEIKAPILLVWGEKDRETPLWMAYKIKKLNKYVSIAIFENEDHFAYYHQMKRFIHVCDYALKGEKL